MPTPEAVVILCNKALKARGFARSHEIAAQMEAPQRAVEAVLQARVDAGELIACDVTLGDERKVIEYRLSAAHGGELIASAPAGRPARTPDPVKERLKEWGSASAKAETSFGTQPSTALDLDAAHRNRAPAAAPPQPAKGDTAMQKLLDQITPIFQAHGPLTSRQLRKHGAKAPNLAMSLYKLAVAGSLKRVNGSQGSTVYGLPTQTARDIKAQQPDAAAPAPRKGKKARRAKKTSAIPMKALPAPTRQPFRPALAADGAIIFLGAKGGAFEAHPQDVRAVLQLSRRLTAEELQQTIAFIDRLDKARVTA